MTSMPATSATGRCWNAPIRCSSWRCTGSGSELSPAATCADRCHARKRPRRGLARRHDATKRCENSASAGPSHPLLALVVFHTCSCFNVIGIVVFVPFVDRFAQFLRRLFPSDPGERAHHIRHVPPEVPEAAITAIEQEARGAFAAACAINHTTLGLPALRVPGATATGLRTGYADLKQLEGEVLRYSVRIPGEQLPESETHQLEQALRSLRASVHAAKSVNDIAHDLDLFANNDDRQIGAALALARRNYADFVTRLFAAVEAQESDDRLVALASLFAQNPRPHRQHRRFEGPCLPRGAGGAASPQRGQDGDDVTVTFATQGFFLSTDPELDGAHGDIVFTAQFVDTTVVDILIDDWLEKILQ